MPAYLIEGVAILAQNQAAALTFHFRRLRGKTAAVHLSPDALGRHCVAGRPILDADAPEVVPLTEEQFDHRQQVRDAELQAIGIMVYKVEDGARLRTMTDAEFLEMKLQVVATRIAGADEVEIVDLPAKMVGGSE